MERAAVVLAHGMGEKEARNGFRLLGGWVRHGNPFGRCDRW